MIVAQAGLGLRVSELCALRVWDVDFLRRTVKISRQVTPDGRSFTTPKTERSARTIPLSEPVGLASSRHIEEYKPLEPIA